MTQQMTIFGAGHKIALVTVPGLVLTLLPGLVFKEVFHFGFFPQSVLLGCGVGLVMIGLCLNFVSAFFMIRAFKMKRLLTSGPYALCRNPMYASFIFFTIPGLSLAVNSWIILATSVLLYVAVTIFVKDEELWLAQHYGEEWKTYVREVGRIFPKIGW